MRSPVVVSCVAVTVALLTANQSPADLVVGYDAAIVGQRSVAANADRSSVLVTDFPLVAGADLVNPGTLTFGFDDWDGEDDDYFRWGFRVNEGFTTKLDSFSIGLSRSSKGPPSVSIDAIVERNSLPVWTDSIATISSIPSNGQFLLENQTLASVPDLLPGDSIIFTLRGSGASGDTGILRLIALDNTLGIAVYGNISPAIAAIPEPSASLFGAVAAIGAASYRLRSGRSRKNRKPQDATVA
ncbi:hypothetical protein Pla175_47460 [Pirellulimonas nuda]|uniref:PEP-CTERM protein-sorting domain-containing protein n=1 Tax=Pirellulimonas nuda TaxID=2528009 RepID=A0A518DIM5_9BACT|nr:hypothetical protein [Pirellulimonas nuda]QDU91325.1 hypothetical protein Pla175_47460 [Pirellulimonas nuda]